MKKYVEFSDKMKKTLRLESSPIAISFSAKAPKGIERMKGEMRQCQMLDTVRFDNKIFYTTSDNHACDGVPVVVG